MPLTKITLELVDRIWKIFFATLCKNYQNFEKWENKKLEFPSVYISKNNSESVFHVFFVFCRKQKDGKDIFYGTILFQKVSGNIDTLAWQKIQDFQQRFLPEDQSFTIEEELFQDGIVSIFFEINDTSESLDYFKKVVKETYEFFYLVLSEEVPAFRTISIPDPIFSYTGAKKDAKEISSVARKETTNSKDLPSWLSEETHSSISPKRIESGKTARLKLSDMGGNKELKVEIAKLISFYKNADHFADWGIRPPCWVLLYGPPGTGKTLAARIIADEIGMNFYVLASTDFESSYISESEKRLKEYFDKLRTPCVVFIDEIDTIARKRSGREENVQSVSDQKVLNTLLQIMDGFSSDKKILFLGATNLIESLDPAILRAGRFDQKIFVDYPDEEARCEIWKLYLTKAAKTIRYAIFDTEADYKMLARMSERFTGADIQEVVRRLAQDYAMGSLHSKWVQSIINTETTIKGLLYIIEKYREEKILNKSISWIRSTYTLHDMAGNTELKEEIGKLIQQYKNKEHFESLGAKVPKGILLYWPPGTGKTLTAKIIAGELGEIFYSLEATSFLSSYTHQSALNLKKIFQELETPCVVFIDEIDTIAQKRMEDPKYSPDLLNTLLQEMDGFSKKRNILFIAATNRIEILDPAILRSGRFDMKILVDYPDEKGRKGLFEFCIHKQEKESKKAIFSSDIDGSLLAAHSENYTGADISEIIRRVVSNYAVQSLKKQDESVISQSDILKEISLFQKERDGGKKNTIGFRL